MFINKEELFMSNEVKMANPAPLGLIGFGMTTVLLNIHNMGLMPLSITIVAMGIAVGGLAQIIAGIMEFKTGNTFGATAFTAYGCFWWTLVLVWIFPKPVPADLFSVGVYLTIWGIFSTFMFIAALTHSNITKIVFGTVVLLFFTLALADFTGSTTIRTIGGAIGFICGAAAMYNSVAIVINGEYGREVLKM